MTTHILVNSKSATENQAPTGLRTQNDWFRSSSSWSQTETVGDHQTIDAVQTADCCDPKCLALPRPKAKRKAAMPPNHTNLAHAVPSVDQAVDTPTRRSRAVNKKSVG